MQTFWHASFVLPDQANETKQRQEKKDILNDPLIHKIICVLYKERSSCVTAIRSNLKQVSAIFYCLQISDSFWGALL